MPKRLRDKITEYLDAEIKNRENDLDSLHDMRDRLDNVDDDTFNKIAGIVSFYIKRKQKFYMQGEDNAENT